MSTTSLWLLSLINWFLINSLYSLHEGSAFRQACAGVLCRGARVAEVPRGGQDCLLSAYKPGPVLSFGRQLRCPFDSSALNVSKSLQVAIPMLPPRLLPAFTSPYFGCCLSLEMIKDGWAVTYEQGGAVYGRWGKRTFLDLEAKARFVGNVPCFFFHSFLCSDGAYLSVFSCAERRRRGSGSTAACRRSRLRSTSDGMRRGRRLGRSRTLIWRRRTRARRPAGGAGSVG